jgi:hypothetical protein
MKITARIAAALLPTVAVACLSHAFAQAEAPSGVVPLQGSQNLESKGNRLIFSPGKEADAHAAEMRKKLGDPQLRKQLRSETRAHVEASNPDLAEVLVLNASERAALFDLLADQQMQHLDAFFAERAAPQTGDDFNARMQRDSTEETRNKQQIKEQIGAERFQRYLDYMDTQMERRQAAYFDGKLDAADKLTTDQKYRLMAIIRTEQQQAMQRQRGAMGLMLPQLQGTYEDIQAMLRKQQLEGMENSFRLLQEDSKTLLGRLPEVLTPSQLAVFTQMENDKVASQRRYVQKMRIDAGLPPEFNEGPPTGRPEGRTPIVGLVRVEVFIRTNNGEPVTADFTTENGKPAAPFAASDGLWVEVTPTLFADGWRHVDYKFFEESDGQRRALPGTMGSEGPVRPAAVSLGTGGGGTMLSGSKAYAIRVDERISSAQ